MTTYMCPVCGFPDLDDEPYTEDGTPSYEMCECCGFQFGYQEGTEQARIDWRHQWIADGCRWQSIGVPAPEDWNATEQLKAVNR